MRIMIPLVIEMTDEQVANYAQEYGLAPDGGKVRDRDVTEHLRSWLLSDMRRGPIGDFADIDIRR